MPQLLKRCVSNLIDNATVYGQRAEIRVDEGPSELTICAFATTVPAYRTLSWKRFSNRSFDSRARAVVKQAERGLASALRATSRRPMEVTCAFAIMRRAGWRRP